LAYGLQIRTHTDCQFGLRIHIQIANLYEPYGSVFGISLSLLCVEEKWVVQEINAFMGAFAIYNFEVKLHALPLLFYALPKF